MTEPDVKEEVTERTQLRDRLLTRVLSELETNPNACRHDESPRAVSPEKENKQANQDEGNQKECKEYHTYF